MCLNYDCSDRLLLAFNCAACSSFKRPKQAHTFRPYFSLISSTASLTTFTSFRVGPLPLATIQYVPALFSNARLAPSKISSFVINGYFSISALEIDDCEQ